MEKENTTSFDTFSNHASASAILAFFRAIKSTENDGCKTGYTPEFTASEIGLITQSSQNEVFEILKIMEAGGLLHTNKNLPVKAYSIRTSWLFYLFEKEGWSNNSPASRLALAAEGNGEFTLSGWRGQDDQLMRHGFVDTNVSTGYDHQMSRITPKGRIVLTILRTMFPTAETTQVAA